MTRVWRTLASGLLMVGVLSVGDAAGQDIESAARPRCAGVPATIVGTPGNDKLRGTNGDDVIVGLGGKDVILGGRGRDLLCGNGGPDTIVGGSGGDRIFGGGGPDTLLGGGSPDRLNGGNGDDFLLGGAALDRLSGGPGNDLLYGGPGPDIGDGGAGVDYCFSIGGPCEPARIVTDFSLVDRRDCGGGNWRSGEYKVNGEVYADSLACEDLDDNEAAHLEYLVNRRYEGFKATVGLRDDSDLASAFNSATDTARFKIIGDGIELASIDVRYGETKLLSADITGVLRLRLQVLAASNQVDVVPVFGTPIVAGNRRVLTVPGRAVDPLPAARLSVDLPTTERRDCGGGNWRVETNQVNAIFYPQSLVCEDLDDGEDAWLRYDLSRAYQRFSAIIGQRDDADQTDDLVRFQVWGDGTLLAERDVPYGTQASIDVSVRRVLNLYLRSFPLSNDADTRPVWAEAIVTG